MKRKYNKLENYITVEIALEEKMIENMPVQPMYYLNLYYSLSNPNKFLYYPQHTNSNYGFYVYELCTIELETEITDLSNTYMAKSIEFIAD